MNSVQRKFMVAAIDLFMVKKGDMLHESIFFHRIYCTQRTGMAGVYGRLRGRGSPRYPGDTVSALARAVLLIFEPEDEAALQFTSVYQDIIDTEIWKSRKYETPQSCYPA